MREGTSTAKGLVLCARSDALIALLIAEATAVGTDSDRMGPGLDYDPTKDPAASKDTPHEWRGTMTAPEYCQPLDKPAQPLHNHSALCADLREWLEAKG